MMSHGRAAVRAVAPLLAAVLLAVACGKKGPLYLPEEARAGPPAAVGAMPAEAPAQDRR